MNTHNPEQPPDVMLSQEYITTSLEVVQDYFRSKQRDLLAVYGRADKVDIKPDGSLVTPKDSEVENELKDLLKLLNPNVGFAGEETEAEGSLGTYWLIDPIDSTRSFIEGKPYCANMAALMHNSQPVCAIVFEFAGKPAHMFSATSTGAMMDGQPLVVDSLAVDQTVWIDCKDVEKREDLYKQAVVNGLTRSELPPPNGYRLTQLAQGNLGVQVCINADAGQYDLVPGLFIAQKAGVTVRNIGRMTWDPSNRDVIAYTSEQDAQKIEPVLTT